MFEFPFSICFLDGLFWSPGGAHSVGGIEIVGKEVCGELNHTVSADFLTPCSTEMQEHNFYAFS